MSDELASGKQLGPFTLDRRLALGGMAEIWLAEQKTERGARPTALKILLAPFGKDPTFRGMFADEVRIASRLTHENIVEVYGSFEVEGHLFQAMEIVDGKDLRRVLSALARAGQSFPVSFALLIAREVARALAYAHSKKGEDGRPLEIVHRDVSPHNIMVDREGRVKVLDFGIATAAERLTRTRTGVIKGKISYMAPEQATAQTVTARTDVFALGIVLWEMLAMQRLFKAESDAAVLERVVRAEVTPIREHNPNVPEEAAALVAHMLQQRPANRPESMRAVENSLTRILLRHFREDQTSTAAFAAWAVNWLDLEPKKTGRFMAPDLPAMEADAAEGPTKSDISGPIDQTDQPSVERTQAMAAQDPLGASGGTSVGEASAQDAEPNLDPTVRVRHADLDAAKEIASAKTMPVRGLEAPPMPIAAAQTLGLAGEEHRLPRRSEIVRAVDAQPTSPMVVDPSVLAGHVGLPKVIDDPQEQRARAPRPHDDGRVSSGKVVGGEVTIPPPKILRRTIEPTDPIRNDPETDPPVANVPSNTTELEISDEHDFKPVRVGFTDAIRALDHQRPHDPRPPAQPQPPPPATAVPTWVYPTFALFGLIIIVLLVLLVLKG